MRLKRIALTASMVVASLAATVSTSSALAQAKVQFFPSLTGRTGPVAPNATPFANGFADYM